MILVLARGTSAAHGVTYMERCIAKVLRDVKKVTRDVVQKAVRYHQWYP